ncbi:MAG: MBL fold metallo-hydrolase [Candidatus Njordarchaeia archaeon]
MTVQIEFHGGVNEIGGNKILIRDKKSNKSIFLDFGKNFSISKKFYEFPFTTPSSISELLEIGAIPKIGNLYTKSNPSNMDFSKDPKPEIDAVFISHVHLDHVGHVTLLSRKIKVYMGDCAKHIIDAMRQSSYSRKEIEHMWEGLNIETFSTGREIEIGDVVVKPVHVDHSIPGAYGFLVYTSSGTIAYTGDFRLHGPEGNMTRDFIKKLESEDIKVLITEGTKVDHSEYMKEDNVEKLAGEVVERSKNLVIADFSKSDYDRFSTFYKIAKKTDRKIVVAPRTAIVLEHIQKCRNIRKRIDVSDNSILILDEEKKRVPKGVKEFMQSLPEEKIVKPADVDKEPYTYIAVKTIYSASELRNLKPPKGTIYILSASEPVDEEREISFERIMNWMEHMGIATFHIHASGHATPLDIRDLIDAASPQTVIPIHTLRPNLMKNFINGNYKWVIPKIGEKVMI